MKEKEKRLRYPKIDVYVLRLQMMSFGVNVSQEKRETTSEKMEIQRRALSLLSRKRRDGAKDTLMRRREAGAFCINIKKGEEWGVVMWSGVK